MSIQNYPKTYPKTYPKLPTTSTEFPFFFDKAPPPYHGRRAFQASGGGPGGPHPGALAGARANSSVKNGRTAIICEVQKNDPHQHWRWFGKTTKISLQQNCVFFIWYYILEVSWDIWVAQIIQSSWTTVNLRETIDMGWYGGFLSHRSPSRHSCFNTKSWWSMTG